MLLRDIMKSALTDVFICVKFSSNDFIFN